MQKKISVLKILKQSVVTFLLSLIPVLAVYYISLSLSGVDLLHSGFISKGIDYFSRFLPILAASSISIITIAVIAVLFSNAPSKLMKVKYLLSVLLFMIGLFFIVTYLNLTQELPFHIVVSLAMTFFIMGVIISAQSIFKYVFSIIMNVFMIISFYALFSSLLAVYSKEFSVRVILFSREASIGSMLLTLFAIFFIIPVVTTLIYKKISGDNENNAPSEKNTLNNDSEDQICHINDGIFKEGKPKEGDI